MADNDFSPISIDPILLVDSYLEKQDWRTRENSTSQYSIGGLILHEAGAVSAAYWLNKVYPTDVSNAHYNCDLHLHDLAILGSYCAGWSIATVLEEGIGGVRGKVNSGPPKHLGTAVQQLVNFLGIMQNEWAGAQALNGFDTYLAPFIKKDGLSYDEVKQCIQYFVYGVNTPSRWGCFDLDTQIEVKLDIIEIETDKGIIRCFKNKKLATLNRGLVYANELTEEDELDETNPQLLAMLITK